MDYADIPKTLDPIVARVTGGEMIKQWNDDKRKPALPFTTYNVISPYIQMAQNTGANEAFFVTVSLNIHAYTDTQAMNLARQLQNDLNSFATRQMLDKSPIGITEIMPMPLRTDVIQNEKTEFIAGLDLKLSVRDTFTEQLDEINSVPIDWSAVLRK